MAAKSKKELLDRVLNVPVTKTMHQRVCEEAKSEERKPADMARVLIRESLDARESHQAEHQQSEGASTKSV